MIWVIGASVTVCQEECAGVREDGAVDLCNNVRKRSEEPWMGDIGLIVHIESRPLKGGW